MRSILPPGFTLITRGRGLRGQVILMFAAVMVAVLAMAALLIDGGLAWSNRREAQNAADTAALAAALALSKGASPANAAWSISGLNGFPADLIDCAGSTIAGQGVVVNNPPLSGPHRAGVDPDANFYVEVIVTRAMQTTFAKAIGMPCWLVSARAVSAVPRTGVAGCSFCSLNNSNKNHTLVLKNGSTLRVDGDIYVNSSNGGYTPGSCTLKQFNVCGDGFDVFGDGGVITARTISVNGGWETHDGNPTQADYLATSCVDTYTPPSQISPWIPSRVCIHMPQIADPLLNIDPPTLPAVPQAGVNGCPSVAAGAKIPTGTPGSPSTLTINTAFAGPGGAWTICPGAYHGGIKILGGSTVKVQMVTGIYYIAGGGFSVTGSASLDGSAGVMIYNSSGSVSGISTTPATIDTVPPPIAGHKNPKLSKGLDSSNNPSDVGELVTYTMTLDRDKAGSPALTGAVSFYDGAGAGGTPTPIAACQLKPLVAAGGTKMAATCPNILYNNFGTHAILAIYFGDTFYNAIGDTLTQTINTPAGATISPLTLSTSGPYPNGNIRLKGMGSGPYAGLTIFQNRTSNLTVTIQPGSGLSPDPCTGNWLTKDVPHVTGGTPPNACGALGGIQGTIYAPNSDALVFVTASGVANLQVIAGKMQIDSDADARFAYTPQFFANSSIRLIE